MNIIYSWQSTVPFRFEFSNNFKCHCSPITIYFPVVQLVMWKIFFLDFKEHIYLQYTLQPSLAQSIISYQLQPFSTLSPSSLTFHAQQCPHHHTRARYMFVEWLHMPVYSCLLGWEPVEFTDTNSNYSSNWYNEECWIQYYC